MIVDVHTHAWPEKVSEKAREALQQAFGVTLIGNPTAETLLTYMVRNGISVSVIAGVATKPEQVPSINQWLFGVRSKRLRVFCALHPQYPLWKEELAKIKAAGDGVKFQPEFQDFYVDDDRFYPLYEELSRLRLPVLFHCGKELSGTKLVRSSPDRIMRLKKDFPDLLIIAGHFGGFQLWEEVRKHILGKDIYLDTAFFFGHLPDKEAREMILSHPAERILFGTDFPLVDQTRDIQALQQMELPRELKERIFYRNACRLLNIPQESVA
jgi:uncharacterized protein